MGDYELASGIAATLRDSKLQEQLAKLKDDVFKVAPATLPAQGSPGAANRTP